MTLCRGVLCQWLDHTELLMAHLPSLQKVSHQCLTQHHTQGFLLKENVNIHLHSVVMANLLLNNKYPYTLTGKVTRKQTYTVYIFYLEVEV
jgi:hypothetical protein